MGVTVKKAVLWRREVANEPGVLAQTLEPLAKAGVNVKVLMGYAYPGDHSRSAIEVFPISGTKASVAAREADLEPSEKIPCLHVEGRDQTGLGHKIATALGDAGVNMTFVMVQVVGDKYSGFFGFEDEDAAARAADIISAAGKSRAKKAAAKKGVKKAGSGNKKAGKTAKKPVKVASIKKAKKSASGKAAQKKTISNKKTSGKKSAVKKPGKKAGKKAR